VSSKINHSNYTQDKRSSSNKSIYILIDLLFILGIVAIIYYFVNFKFGHYLFSGDFRFHINKELIGDQFLGLISTKFSNNNFVFLSFYSLYYFMQFIPYYYILVYIFFGIPILLFLSMKYVLLRITNYEYDRIAVYLFICSLSFYYAINPALFSRFHHWPILNSFVLFPPYIYFLYKYLQEGTYFNKYLWTLPLLLFVGAASPYSVLVYFMTSVILYITVLIVYKMNIREYLAKGVLILISAVIPFLHIIYPAIIKQGAIRAPWEAITSTAVLYSLSRNSNIITALSGTNFHEDVVKFPITLSVGFLIFILTVLFYVASKKPNKLNTILLSYSLFSLIIIAGYRTFSYIFDTVSGTFISNVIWIVKDPNVYYLVLVLLLCFLLSRLVVFSKTKTPYILFMAFSVIFLNIIFLFSANRGQFNREHIHFIDVPKDYFVLANTLENNMGRNLWLPYGIYTTKNFSEDITYFPSPSLWLTKNKELTYSTAEYKNLIDSIEHEIYDNKCRNVHFLNWIIAVQNLNVIIDKNSVDDNFPLPQGTERKLKTAEKSITKLPNIYKYRSIGNIDIYKSNLQIKDELYTYTGDINDLNEFLKDNPVNIIYEPSTKTSVQRIAMPYTILNESYDQNWLDSNGKPPKYKVNFASMLFEKKNQTFSYRGEFGLKRVLIIQKVLLLIFAFLAILYSFPNRKSILPSNRRHKSSQVIEG